MSMLIPDPVDDDSSDGGLVLPSDLDINDNSWIGREFETPENFKRVIREHFPFVNIKQQETWKIGDHMGEEKKWVVTCPYSGLPKRKANPQVHKRSKKCGKCSTHL